MAARRPVLIQLQCTIYLPAIYDEETLLILNRRPSRTSLQAMLFDIVKAGLVE